MCGRMIYYRAARSRGDVIFFRWERVGVVWFGDEMRINLASERRRG